MATYYLLNNVKVGTNQHIAGQLVSDQNPEYAAILAEGGNFWTSSDSIVTNATLHVKRRRASGASLEDCAALMMAAVAASLAVTGGTRPTTSNFVATDDTSYGPNATRPGLSVPFSYYGRDIYLKNSSPQMSFFNTSIGSGPLAGGAAGLNFFLNSSGVFEFNTVAPDGSGVQTQGAWDPVSELWTFNQTVRTTFFETAAFTGGKFQDVVQALGSASELALAYVDPSGTNYYEWLEVITANASASYNGLAAIGLGFPVGGLVGWHGNNLNQPFRWKSQTYSGLSATATQAVEPTSPSIILAGTLANGATYTLDFQNLADGRFEVDASGLGSAGASTLALKNGTKTITLAIPAASNKTLILVHLGTNSVAVNG